MSEVKLPHFVLNRNHTLIPKTGLAVRFESFMEEFSNILQRQMR